MGKREFVVVTGATGAIGAEICRGLATDGYGLILACRSYPKAEALVKTLPSDTESIFLKLDLADSEVVRQAVSELSRIVPPEGEIVGLINNAGIMAGQFALSPSGHEMDMTVNYLNTQLLTRLIIQSGLMREGSSIVFTTSLTRHLSGGNAIPADPTADKFSRLGTYGASKKAVTLHAATLWRQLQPNRIGVNCADPGIVDTGMITMQRWFDPVTDILFRPFIRSPKKGAQPALRAFKAGREGKSGGIYCRKAIHALPEPQD